MLKCLCLKGGFGLKYKNIVIIGPPKSGKTTLAKMIVKKISGYSLISNENMKTSFLSANLSFKDDTSHKNVFNNDFCNLQTFFYLKHSSYYEDDIGYVTELNEYNEKLFELFKKENCLLLFVTYSKLSKEKLFETIRKYSKENDWTSEESDYSLKKYCALFYEENKEYEKYAQKNYCWHIDVSKDKEKVLQDTLEKIKNICTNEK